MKASGAPWYPGKQEQMALWLITLHSALTPQMPGPQGDLHFWSIQARFCWHSELTKHSGLQLGGSPMYPGRQVHTQAPFSSLKSLYNPQGLGSHGSRSSITGSMTLLQDTEGFPSYPWRQSQRGTWFRTEHTALIPHRPGQGSTHFWFLHTLLLGQSWFWVHSGRHERNGSPKYPGTQIQVAARFFLLHTALSPHGLGEHGSTGSAVKNGKLN